MLLGLLLNFKIFLRTIKVFMEQKRQKKITNFRKFQCSIFN